MKWKFWGQVKFFIVVQEMRNHFLVVVQELLLKQKEKLKL